MSTKTRRTRTAMGIALCALGVGAVTGLPSAEAAPTPRGQSCAEARFDPSTPYAPDINPANFTTDIDNPFSPMQPGMKWVYRAKSKEGRERIVVKVTDRTKTIMGVTTRVVRDTAYLNGEVKEDTFDYFAQDDEGCVWYFGERTKEFDGGMIDTSGSWIAGRDGAQPGVVMEADPAVGDKYRQEYLVDEAEDQGEVLELGVDVTVPFGSFTDGIVTLDTTRLDPESVENKTYVEGIGNVLSVHTVGKAHPERLVRFVTG